MRFVSLIKKNNFIAVQIVIYIACKFFFTIFVIFFRLNILA